MSNSSKYNCGQILPSSCIPFTGSALTFLVEPDELECDANINDVIAFIDKYLKKVIDGNDFSELETDCLTFNPETVTAKELHALEIAEICVLKGQVEALNTLITELDISTEIITIDLECLAPDAAACEVASNQYTLQSILQLFRSKLCDFETRISNLES